jgi:hypothetical protein
VFKKYRVTLTGGERAGRQPSDTGRGPMDATGLLDSGGRDLILAAALLAILINP